MLLKRELIKLRCWFTIRYRIEQDVISSTILYVTIHDTMQYRIQRDTVRYDTMHGVMFLVASNGLEACCGTKRVECPYWSAEVTSPITTRVDTKLTSRAVIYFEAYKTCCVKCGAHRPRWDFNSPHPFFFFPPCHFIVSLSNNRNKLLGICFFLPAHTSLRQQ